MRKKKAPQAVSRRAASQAGGAEPAVKRAGNEADEAKPVRGPKKARKQSTGQLARQK